jgi:protocatechuate 3,4-dioxygenase beta subunit
VKSKWIAMSAFAVVFGLRAYGEGPPPTPQPPENVSTIGTIATASERGQPLQITGQVFASDGATPAAGVIVYAYQTDASGHYQNDPVTRIARLHGWAKTDSQGRFEFRTIRPGPYPGRDIPAHVHFHVWGSGYPLQWTKDLLYADDPLLKPAMVEESKQAGKFANVCAVVRNREGVEVCRINFQLLKETNYPAEYRDDPRIR